MLAVTGAVASNNASRNDDLDVFIICQHKRVWITRFFVFFILKALGRYAQDDDKERKICPNIYLDEKKLEWPEEKQNLYVAYEIASMHPLIDKNFTYFRFLRENEWIFKHFKNLNVEIPKRLPKTRRGSVLIDRLEDFFRTCQHLYMKKHLTTETVKKHLIHFNKHDHSERILEEYKEFVEKI